MQPRLGVCLVRLHLLLVGIKQHRGTWLLLVDAKDRLVFPVVLSHESLCLRNYLEVGPYHLPLYEYVVVSCLQLVNLSPWLAIVAISQFQPCHGIRQHSLAIVENGQLPLLVAVRGIRLPREHLAFLIAMVAIVQGRAVERIYQHTVSFGCRLVNLPYLRHGFLVDRRKRDCPILVVQGKSVPDFETIPLLRVIIL